MNKAMEEGVMIRMSRWNAAGVFAVAILTLCVGARAVHSQGESAPSAGGQGDVAITEVSPGVLVLSTGAGNLVASVGADGALLIGTPAAADTARIAEILDSKTKSAARYVIVEPGAPNESEGDVGWGKRGAFVAMQELALQRMGGNVMGAPDPLPERFVQLGVERPRIAFSHVLAFDLNGEAIHVVHQAAGQTSADCLVHFHVAGLVYLGEMFPGDGYPRIELEHGGNVDGLIKNLDGWTDKNLQVVGARGKVTDGLEVKAFVGMLVAVRDRVKGMVRAGETESAIVAKKPAAEFDARWGHGRVSGDEFVRAVVGSEVASAKAKAAAGKAEMRMESKPVNFVHPTS